MKRNLLVVLLGIAMTAMVIGGCGKKEETAPVEATEMVTEDTEKETEKVEVETETEEPVEEVAETEEVVEEAPAPVQTTMYAQQKCNVRSLPSTDGEILGTLSTNDPVVVVGEISEDGWYTVNYCEKTGYISGKLLGTGTVEVKKTATASKKTTTSTDTQATTPSTDAGRTQPTQDVQVDIGATQQPAAETPAPAPEAPAEPAFDPTGGYTGPAVDPTGGTGVDDGHGAIISTF